MAKKYLSHEGLTEYDALIKTVIAEGDSSVLAEAKKDVVSVDGGGSITLNEIFGAAPYTIEATSEEESFSAIDMTYDNSISGLSSTNVQGAIDEVKALAQVVPTNTDYSEYRVRNIAILSEIPTTMNNGDIAFVYTKEG